MLLSGIMQFIQGTMLQSRVMLKKFVESPWSGAVGAVLLSLWEAFWLVGPPVGLTQENRKEFLVWGAIALAISLIQAFGTLLKRNRELNRKMLQIKEATPLIKLKIPGAVHCEMVQHTFWDEGTKKILFTGQVPFLRVAFHNDPPNSSPKSVAKEIRAYINFFPIRHSLPSLRIYGK